VSLVLLVALLVTVAWVLVRVPPATPPRMLWDGGVFELDEDAGL
jgi:hypothetical protein